MDGAVAAHNVTADRGHGYFAESSEGDELWWESDIAPMTWRAYSIQYVPRTSWAMQWVIDNGTAGRGHRHHAVTSE